MSLSGYEHIQPQAVEQQPQTEELEQVPHIALRFATDTRFILGCTVCVVAGVSYFIAKEDTRNKIKINLTKTMITMAEKAIRSNLNINCYVPVLKEIMEI
jgi:presenilin-like A22 family membrane protease